jgi:ABC-2 type transport system ATP-binding protein
MTKIPTTHPVIKINGVGKTFILSHDKTASLKKAAINVFRSKPQAERFNVLRDVSFEINKGEFFGILGRNGSGKSTLLKLLASIYTPTTGNITIEGRLTPFIELGVGFNPELTGTENVYLNGAILGLTEKEISDKYEEIVKFAEIERFMDQKLKNYSSGMQVRLAFAIAISAHNEVLLIDEVLAVGDERFQNKCLKVFRDIKNDPEQTVVFVSHDMASVQKFCDRVAVIHDGDVKFIGDPQEGTLLYKELNFPELMDTEKYGDSDSRAEVRITNAKGKPQATFRDNEEMLVHVKINNDQLRKEVKNAGVAIYTQDGQYVFGPNTVLDEYEGIKGDFIYKVKLNLGAGRYFLKIGLFGDSPQDIKLFSDHAVEFSMNGSKDWEGLTNLEHSWSK